MPRVALQTIDNQKINLLIASLAIHTLVPNQTINQSEGNRFEVNCEVKLIINLCGRFKLHQKN